MLGHIQDYLPKMRVFTMRNNRIEEGVIAEVVTNATSKKYLIRTIDDRFYAEKVYKDIDTLKMELEENRKTLTQAEYDSIISLRLSC